MKLHKSTVLAMSALIGIAGFSTSAYAENVHLQLEIKPGRTALSMTPVHAKVGDFGLSHSLPQHAKGDQLRVISRNAKGVVVHEILVPNHLSRRVETFNPKTGAIEHSETVKLDSALIDVVLPFNADVASIQVLPQSAPTQSRGQLRDVSRDAGSAKFDRAQILNLVNTSTVRARMAPPPAAAATPTLTTILNNGSTASKMDFVFIGDGYTSAEMAKWRTDAQGIIDAFKADPLLAANLSKINIHRVDIASTQSGADEIDKGIYVSTAMDGEFGCYNTARLLCVNTSKVFNLVGRVLPVDGREQVIVISNSTRYGGSGGQVATVSMALSAKEVALHEIGHSSFALADEYDYGTCNASVEPTANNVSRYWDRNNSKWGDLIGTATPVPTQVGVFANGTVGTFQGGHYCTSGIYRPTENSRMRTLGNAWHAVNTRLANQVFANYGGGAGNELTQTGSIATGATVTVPSSSPTYVQAGAGTFTVKLSGPSGTDFDLFLFKWNGSTWAQVASSEGSSSTETITYNGTAGYYYATVKAYSGSGTYTVKYTFPPK